MAVIVFVALFTVGAILVVGMYWGLARAADTVEMRRFRAAGRTLTIENAIQRVLEQGFVFVHNKTSLPGKLWVLRESLSKGEKPLQAALRDEGLVVDGGREALDRVLREPELRDKMILCSGEIFID